MKRLLLLAIAIPFLFACSKGGDNNGTDETDASSGASVPTEEPTPQDSQDKTDGNGKLLIVFFSRAGENWQVGVVDRGNTAIMVDYMKDYLGADVFEIVPEVAYPVGYEDCKTVATSEKNSNARPKFKGKVDNIDQYDYVFIGGPVWWGEPPMIIRTFCDAYPELKDKTLIPFGTHGGSGVSSYTAKLKEHFPNAKYLEALGLSGSAVRNESSRTAVESWLKKLGFDKAEAKDK